jgi:hypothetical protein
VALAEGAMQNSSDLLRNALVDVAAGIDAPIVPGILPVSNVSQTRRMADMCGTAIPAWMIALFEGLDDLPAARAGGKSGPKRRGAASTLRRRARQRRGRTARTRARPRWPLRQPYRRRPRPRGRHSRGRASPTLLR